MKSKLKILQINSVVNYGSTGHIVEEIGKLILLEGWDSIIGFGRYGNSKTSESIKIGTTFDMLRHGFKTRFFDKHGFGSINATKAFIAKIKFENPDLIHLHNLHGYYLNIEILFNYLASTNIPIVWTLHDCWPITGHCAYFDFVGCEKWKTTCHDCPQKNKYPKSILYDNSKRNYIKKKKLFLSINNLVLCPASNWLGKIIKESFLGDFPIKVIQNGVDLNVFCPQINRFKIKEKYSFENKFLILGIASVWDERKGLQDFIKLSSRLTEDYIIVLIGIDKKKQKELPSNIIGICRTDNIKELAEMYSAADVFFNPTWEDNFPTTNLEALACGTPVITYNTGGSIEAISKDTGYIVEKGDFPELLKILSKVKDLGKESFTNACRERAVDYFNRDDRFREYIDLYNCMINKH